MKHESNGSNPFTIVFSGKIHRRIEELAAEATQAGQSEAYFNAVHRIIRRLEADPVEFGEPADYLPHMKVLSCTATVGPLFVRFGVREDLHLVFLVEIDWLTPPEE